MMIITGNNTHENWKNVYGNESDADDDACGWCVIWLNPFFCRVSSSSRIQSERNVVSRVIKMQREKYKKQKNRMRGLCVMRLGNGKPAAVAKTFYHNVIDVVSIVFGQPPEHTFVSICICASRSLPYPFACASVQNELGYVRRAHDENDVCKLGVQ